MSTAPYGRHAVVNDDAVHSALPADRTAGAVDPLSRRALEQEIETSRRAEFRLLVWTATSLLAVAILITVHLLWL